MPPEPCRGRGSEPLCGASGHEGRPKAPHAGRPASVPQGPHQERVEGAGPTRAPDGAPRENLGERHALALHPDRPARLRAAPGLGEDGSERAQAPPARVKDGCDRIRGAGPGGAGEVQGGVLENDLGEVLPERRGSAEPNTYAGRSHSGGASATAFSRFLC